jgi:hypothetical protein
VRRRIYCTKVSIDTLVLVVPPGGRFNHKISVGPGRLVLQSHPNQPQKREWSIPLDGAFSPWRSPQRYQRDNEFRGLFDEFHELRLTALPLKVTQE